MADTFIERLEAEAAAAEREETTFRATYRDKLETLERERTFAHRRAAFARKLAGNIADAEDEQAAMAAGERLLFNEFGLTALRTFEAWYQARTGVSFYALYDIYVPQTPVVDF